MASNRPIDVLVIGSVNVDLVFQAARAPLAGETLIGHGFARFGGGKGANQAVAAARLGAQVSLISCVGADLFGREQLNSLRESGVCVRHVVEDSHTATGVAGIVVEGNGQNRIIVVPGANHRLSPAHVEARRAIFAQARVVLLQLEIPMSTVLAAARAAEEAGCTVVLNPAPVPPEGLPNELLSRLAVITPNETEAEQLTGIKTNSLQAAERAARTLQSAGVQTAVITLGDRGVLGVSGAEAFYHPAWEVPVVDTTAAGDAFSGALAAGLAMGVALPRAVEWANAVAALTVTRPGAQPSLPTQAEVQRFVAARGREWPFLA